MNYELKMYSIFDRVSASYGTPFFLVNDAAATRSFNDLVNDPQSSVFRHYDDYSLYRVGSFFPSEGKVEAKEPVFIVGASSLFRDVQSPISGIEKGGKG